MYKFLVGAFLALVSYSIVSASAESALGVQVFRAGGGVANVTVTATMDNALVVVQTDADGYAWLGNLAQGDWVVSACGQSLNFMSDSNDGSDALAVWMVECNQVFLPVMAR